MNHGFIDHLTSISNLMHQEQSLEEGLRDLARLSARSLRVERCSVMLLMEEDDERKLKVCSHFGEMSQIAYSSAVPLDQGIAGHVVRTGESLLIDDVTGSEFAHLARRADGKRPSLMSVPIRVAQEIIGAINVSEPMGRAVFSTADLDLLEVFALFVGKSIQVYQLQKLSESRLQQLAQLLERREKGGRGDARICPDPGRLAKLVAKNFYRELAAAGFGPNAIITVSSQVLSELNASLSRHRSRFEREHGPDTR